MTTPSQGGSHHAGSTNSDTTAITPAVPPATVADVPAGTFPDPAGNLDTETTATAEPAKGASAEQIENDIDRTRHDLGETVEALAGKLDVKTQTRRQVDEVKSRASNELNLARQRAAGYLGQAKNAVTDERGKPNRNGWIGLSLAAAVVTAVIVSIVRSRR